MNLRVVHLADMHSNLRSRQAEAHRVLSWIVDDIREKKPDLILDAGDVFDVYPTPEEEDWTARFYRALAEIAPVVGATGNHALGARPIPRLLLPADQAEPPTRHPITVLDRPGVVYAAGAAVACLPWPKRGHLMAATAGAGVEQRRVGGIAAIDDVLRGLGAELERHDGPRILIAHAMVRSARVGRGQPMEVGQEFETAPEQLALASADYVALGHIHLFQHWTWARGDWWTSVPMVMPGSPYSTDFGDTDRKGYVLVEIDQGACGCVKGCKRGACGACSNRGALDWDRVFTPATPMVHVETDYVGGGPSHFMVRPGTEPGDPRGAMLRIRYHVSAAERDAASRAMEQKREELLAAGAANVVLEPIIKPVVRARAPEIASQSSLPAQWETWARSTGLEEDRIRRCMALVQDLESEGAGQ